MAIWLPMLALLAQVNGVSTEGVRASASETAPSAFIHQGPLSVDEWLPAIGHVQLDVHDRVRAPMATYGDEATLRATASAGGDTWTIELNRPGFPPTTRGQVSPMRAYVHFPFAGGVLLDQEVAGYSGIGLLPGTGLHAAIAVWGEGTVSHNGSVLTDHALIEAFALSAGNHADDQTFRSLPQARPGDTEVVIFATNLPTSQVPEGFVRLGFDDVRIDVGGVAVASIRNLPTEGGEYGAAVAPVGLPGMYAAAPVTNFNPATQNTGTGGAGTAGQTPPLGSAEGESFQATGLVATPPVSNNGSTSTPTLGTPQPLNNSPATPLPSTPQPSNAQAANPLLPAVPLPGAPSPTSPAGTGTPTTPATNTTTGTTAATNTTPNLPAPAIPAPTGPVFSSPTGQPNAPSSPGGPTAAPVLPPTPPTAPSTPGNGPSATPGAPVLPSNPNVPLAPPPPSRGGH